MAGTVHPIKFGSSERHPACFSKPVNNLKANVVPIV
jgi:hypothetical protein